MIASDDSLSPRKAFLLDQLTAAMVDQIEVHLESVVEDEGLLDSMFEQHPTLVDDIIELCLAEA